MGIEKKNNSLLAILNTLKTGNAYCITSQYNKKKRLYKILKLKLNKKCVDISID